MNGLSGMFNIDIEGNKALLDQPWHNNVAPDMTFDPVSLDLCFNREVGPLPPPTHSHTLCHAPIKAFSPGGLSEIISIMLPNCQ